VALRCATWISPCDRLEAMMASLTERMLGAAKLDVATYEEVEADATATPQAMLVVVVANLAAGVGAGSWASGACW
jgi:hypothetical protein